MFFNCILRPARMVDGSWLMAVYVYVDVFDFDFYFCFGSETFSWMLFDLIFLQWHLSFSVCAYEHNTYSIWSSICPPTTSSIIRSVNPCISHYPSVSVRLTINSCMECLVASKVSSYHSTIALYTYMYISK